MVLLEVPERLAERAHELRELGGALLRGLDRARADDVAENDGQQPGVSAPVDGHGANYEPARRYSCPLLLGYTSRLSLCTDLAGP